MIKITLFIAITVLLLASHFMAAVLGYAVADEGDDRSKWKTKIAWLLGLSVLPWAVAMLLIAVVAA